MPIILKHIHQVQFSNDLGLLGIQTGGVLFEFLIQLYPLLTESTICYTSLARNPWLCFNSYLKYPYISYELLSLM
jgi:hypothetical protein